MREPFRMRHACGRSQNIPAQIQSTEIDPCYGEKFMTHSEEASNSRLWPFPLISLRRVC